jgi:hypothetical protein
MKLMIQLKEEDLREANANAYVQKSKPKGWRIGVGIVGWFVFVFMALLIWLLWHSGAVASAGVPEPAEPTFDLMLVLLPSIVAALWLVVLLSASLMMQVQVARSRSPFGKAGYARVQKTKWFAVLLVVALVPVFLSRSLPVVVWRGGRFSALLIGFVPWIIAFFVVMVILHLFNRAVMANEWAQNASLQGPTEMELDDAKVISRTANGEEIYRWSAFLRFRELDNLFVLVTENATFLMVPKRDLNSQGVILEFRALIQAHIAEGYFLALPDAAFPVLRPASLPPPPLARMEMRQG